MLSIMTVISATTGITASASTIYGDVNNDGAVGTSDTVALNKYLSGMISNINMKYADVDKNTVIDVNDSKVLLKYLVHSVEFLPYSESGSTFNYLNYIVPTDSARTYVKYNCSNGNQNTYTLQKPSSTATISGDYDDRQIDSSSNAQCIVYLTFNDSNGDAYRGSGFIVSNHIIATAAHVLYDGVAFSTDLSVKVYNKEGTSVVAAYDASELHVPANYVNDLNDNYDYGLIYVEDDLSAYGNMSLGIVTNNFPNTSQAVNVSGFPGSVNNVNTNSRYYGTGNITSSTTNSKLYYTAYASGGDSGGPVYIEYNLKGSTFRSAIGIHTLGGSDGSVHGGVRITQPILRFYNNNPNIG